MKSNINLKYLKEIYSCSSHKDTIELIQNGDKHCNGIRVTKDKEKGFSQYYEAFCVLDSFEGRCAFITP